MSDENASSELDRIIRTAELELRQIHPGLFSPEGFHRLTERINEFIGELTIESVKVAKRHQSDSVSPAYVDQASEHLAWHLANPRDGIELLVELEESF